MAEYIEREAAIKSLLNDSPERVSYSREDAADCIRYMEAADVAPVRHGRWVQVIVHVEVDDGFMDRLNECCSVCHEPNGRQCKYFCPNCGAKMDLEVTNDA